MNDFQESLKDLLMENNLNYAILTKDLNLSTGTISAYFCNGTYPTTPIAIKLANYFNCSLDYLFGISETKDIKYKIDYKSICKNFVNNFEKCLRQSGISNAKAMRELGIRENALYRWKAGVTPRMSNIVTIAKYLNVSIDYLLGHDC